MVSHAHYNMYKKIPQAEILNKCDKFLQKSSVISFLCFMDHLAHSLSYPCITLETISLKILFDLVSYSNGMQ